MRLTKGWTEPMTSQALAEVMACAKSLARRRLGLSHAGDRSTTQRRGRSTTLLIGKYQIPGTLLDGKLLKYRATFDSALSVREI